MIHLISLHTSTQIHRVLAALLLLFNRCSSFQTTLTNKSNVKLLSSTSLPAVPTNKGQITVTRPDNSQHQLVYRIARPVSLTSRQAAPIITLHGGPGLPSTYLYPLEDVIPYRSIVYFDQLGCGKSDEPTDVSLYSIEYSVGDLKQLIKQLGIRRFHLYGHSYGGILAFEYMKNVANQNEDGVECLSAVLSSAPYNIPKLDRDFERLTKELMPSDRSLSESELDELFRITHQCRLDQMPSRLTEAYSNIGTVWSGTQAIADYVALPPNHDAGRMPSTMIMKGEFDFVGEESFDEWKKVFNHKFVRFKTLEGCSHHALYENGLLYGETIDSYFAEYD